MQTSYLSQKYVMAVAFLAAQREMTPFMLSRDSSLRQLEALSNYAFELAGVRVTHTLEHRGYRTATGWLFPIEGEEQFFHMVFSLEKINP